jgi:hypothetical protein
MGMVAMKEIIGFVEKRFSVVEAVPNYLLAVVHL